MNIHANSFQKTNQYKIYSFKSGWRNPIDEIRENYRSSPSLPKRRNVSLFLLGIPPFYPKFTPQIVKGKPSLPTILTS